METEAMNEKQVLERSKKSLLWISMVSMFMVFAGLTSAYYVRMMKKDWLHFELPKLFYVSTVVIIISSITMNWVIASVKKNDFKNVTRAAGITLLLCILFGVFQVLAWSDLYDNNIVLAGKFSNAAGSFLYILTGLHLAHIVGGFFALLVVWARSLKQKYNSESYLGIKLCAIFWHFLDALWVYLFIFLLILR